MTEDIQDVVVTGVVAEEPKRRGRPPKAKETESMRTVSGDTDAQIAELQAQVKLLTSALSQSRQVEPAEDEETVGVMKIGGGNLSMDLTDAYGRHKHFYWEKDGEVIYMTPAQYEEMMDSPGGKKFVEKKWLQLASDPVSAMLNVANYINSLNIDSIFESVDKIEEVTTLQRILSHLEAVRVITEDGEGKQLVTREGAPRAEVIEWSVKERMVAQACADRLYALTGVRYSLTDG